MIVVIFAGGAGTRLWPLSTPEYPKHLLKIDGDELSLVQHAYERAKQVAEKVYVATEASHVQHVKDQLSELPDEAFIVEPGRRGTAHCIMAALAEIGKGNDADEPIAFIHADHYIRDITGFAHSFSVARDISAKEGRIVLVGVEPAYAATCFGYIKKGTVEDEEKFVFNVDSFKEKPDQKTAQEYLNSGNYLWNGGYFVGSINTFRKTMQRCAPDLNERYLKLAAAKTVQEFEDIYLAFESIAIDYALIEKTDDLLVVPAAFDWMDVGSYTDLYKVANRDAAGNHSYGRTELEEVENSFIQNYEDKPVVVIGLDNVVVINTPNGILVARKDASQKVGDVSKRLSAKAQKQ
ncbi:MAG TPA: mannose-1-phosphate guanylyltransferase [Patescibacteria group bacterium]|nr:mannose-1-phosphate guanylyltransferase [Patescibacteria group bacterium]